MYTRMHRGANPSSAMSAAMPGAFARATIQPPEMKTQSPSGSRGRALVRISNLPPWLSLLCMVIYIKAVSYTHLRTSSNLGEETMLSRSVIPLMVTMPWSSHLQYAQVDLYIAIAAS